MLFALTALLLFFAPLDHLAAAVSAQPQAGGDQRATTRPSGGQPTEHETRPEAQEEAHEAGGLWPTVARFVNFGILAGVLAYLLRSPIATHLQVRATQVTHDLAVAAKTRAEAAAQLEDIDRKLKALPQELEDLKARGAEEVAAEEARIRQAAQAERQRLLEQARRDIEMQVRVARRELTEHAATLATGLARDRLKQVMTDADHLRLVDRYARQVKETR